MGLAGEEGTLGLNGGRMSYMVVLSDRCTPRDSAPFRHLQINNHSHAQRVAIIQASSETTTERHSIEFRHFLLDRRMNGRFHPTDKRSKREVRVSLSNNIKKHIRSRQRVGLTPVCHCNFNIENEVHACILSKSLQIKTNIRIQLITIKV